MVQQSLIKKLLNEKDYELLKNSLQQNTLIGLDEDVVVEMHLYDKQNNHIYSKHQIDPSTYKIISNWNDTSSINETEQQLL